MDDPLGQVILLALVAVLVPVIAYAYLATRPEPPTDERLWHKIYSSSAKTTITGERVNGNLYRRRWNGKWEYKEGDNDPLDSQW